MTLRPLAVLSLVGLLAGLVACSTAEPPKPAAPAKPAPNAIKLPAGAEVELALLVIDERNRPQKLLSSTKLVGNNQSLPFQLRFNPEAFPDGARVELRGRASQSGQLTLHLPSVLIAKPETQSVGQLQLFKMP